ncbi:amino acid adenylation domain-containing protein [Catenulispora sp. EB89]|uniref:AMP-binding protein n=1 Tax=Catenulispora sp. EB89 TaxID=3156257 RepID=UPI003512CED1
MTDPAYRDVPATEVQQGLWLLRALGQEPAARCRAYRVVGDLDVAALAEAWRALVDRHEGLRSALVLQDGAPVRRVWTRSEPEAFRTREIDAQDWTPADANESDPADVPVRAQLTVTRRGPEDHQIHLAVPRAFADEDFLDTLVGELSELSAGRALRTDIPSAGAPVAEAADDPEALAWWVNALTPLPSELPLPADRPRPDRGSGRWGTVSAPADPDLGRAVARCAEASRSSPSVVMLTGFQVLLHRYTGGDRVAVAVPVPQRGAGAAANVLILPADIEAGQSFKDVLERGTTLAAEAMARRAVPLARVLGALPIVREVRRVPLGDVVFDYRGRPRSVLAIPGAVVEPCPDHGGPAPADLVLQVDDGGNGPALTVLYDADQFEPATARMILRQFRTLLRHAGRAPDTAVGELTLDGPGEAARAAVEADRRADDGAPGHTIVEAVRRRASQDPDAVAIDSHDGTLTYRELYAAAIQVAEDLHAAGVRAGEAVVVRLPVGARQYAALLGVLAAGAHLTWFGVADSGERGRAVVGALRPAAMLVADPADPDEFVGWYRATTGGRVVAVAAAEREPEPAPAPESESASQPSAASALPISAFPRLADRAYVAFTSGTTGVPKGIAQTHAALAQFAAWMAAEFEIGPGVRVAQWVAAEHDPALAETFAALGSGATLCPVPEKIRANPERLLHWLGAERIGVLQTVPSFARELLRVLTGRHSAERLGTLRVLLLMGEALPAELADGLLAALPLVHVANLYGPTETVAATWHPVRRRAVQINTLTGIEAASTAASLAARRASGTVPIGRPIPGRGILILDESDRVCPAGVTGELVITGAYVADGYLGAHDHAAFAPLPGIDAPCYRTGDLARRRPDGALEYRGRKDSQVKLYGNRLELTDVEAALAGHPTVAECAVVAVADRDGLAVRLVVCVVPRRGPDGRPEGAPDQWRTQLRRRFGRALLPALYRTLDRLPRTVTGKVDRPQLARSVAAAERDASARRPAAGTEAVLAAIWASLLGAPPEHADQSFFTLGGSSLMVPRLLHQVRRRLAADVTVPQFYAHQSLAALAALVDRTR